MICVVICEKKNIVNSLMSKIRTSHVNSHMIILDIPNGVSNILRSNFITQKKMLPAK